MEYNNMSIFKIVGICIASQIITLLLALVFEEETAGLTGMIFSILFYTWSIGYVFFRAKLTINPINKCIDISGLKKDVLFVLKITILVVMLSVSNLLVIIPLAERILPNIITEILNRPDNSEQIKLVYVIIQYGLITVFVAPISEEIIFRFAIFNKLKIKYSNIVSITVTSTFFMILHQSYNIFDAFIFSVVMCIIYDKSQNLLLPIAIHIINNAFGVLIMIYEFTTKNQQKIDVGYIDQIQRLCTNYWWIPILVSISILIALTISIRRKFWIRHSIND